MPKLFDEKARSRALRRRFRDAPVDARRLNERVAAAPVKAGSREGVHSWRIEQVPRSCLSLRYLPGMKLTRLNGT